MKAASEREETVKAIVKVGGSVAYDWEFDKDGISPAKRITTLDQRGCGSCSGTSSSRSYFCYL